MDCEYIFRGFDENIEGNYEIRARGPQVSLLGPYKISGKILVLPIQGEGQSNITISKCTKYFNNRIVLTKNYIIFHSESGTIDSI